ncbi:MAG: DUF2079 domain-containing protein [Chloroflexota bacterium]
MTQAVRTRFVRPHLSLPRLLLLLLSLLYFVYFGLYATRRYLALETGAFDLGVYVQPMWNFIQGRNFSASLIADNGPLRWATHVEPILWLVAPVYRLWPDPRTLLWLQVGAMSLTALPLFGLAVSRLRSEWAALAVALAFFLMPAVEAVTLFDFHAVALMPLFLLSALYFLERALAAPGKSLWLWPAANERLSEPAPDKPATCYLLSGLFFLLALSTKEDIPLYVLMIGLYLLVLRRRGWEGGGLIGVSLLWFYLATQVIIPAYRTGGEQSIYLAWFETLGDTPLEIVLSPFTQPDKVLALLFRPGSLPALGMLLLPPALLPLAGLPLLLPAAPGLAFSFLSQNPTLRQLETWHYAAPMLPFVWLAAIDGLARLAYYVSRVIGHVSRNPKPDTRYLLLAPRFPLYALTLLLLLTGLIYHHLRGYSHLSRLSEWPEVTPHHRLGREIAAAIPAEAAVLAQAQLAPYVAHRERLKIWSGPLFTAYDYAWLDLSHPKFPNRFNAHGDFLTGMVIEPAFGALVSQDGYILLKKDAPRRPLSEELFTFTGFDQIPAAALPFDAAFGDTLKLAAVKPEVRRLATSETEPQIILYFETLQKPAQDYHLFVYLLDPSGTITGATDYPQPALFWWPTSRWQAGDRRQVRVNTMPWWSGDKTVFGYAVGLSRAADPWDISARLPVTINQGSNPPGSRPLDQGTLLPVVAFRRLAGLPYPQPLTVLPEAGSRK